MSSESDVTFDVFANDGFFVMTSNVVPFDSVSVKVIENGHTGFGFSVLLDLFTVIRLSSGRVESSGKRPIVEGGR